jgi:hypothetical protein
MNNGKVRKTLFLHIFTWPVINDINIQHHFVGDGKGNIEWAGFCIPPSALKDGTNPSAETLFNLSLHEVKGLFESQLYLKNLLPPSRLLLEFRQQYWTELDVLQMVNP